MELSGNISISGRMGFMPAPPSELVITPADLSDNGYNGSPIVAGETTYYYSSSLARFVFSTNATVIRVDGYSTIAVDSPPQTRLGVRVAGVDVATVIPTANGAFSLNVNLAAGTKTVEIIIGGQNKPPASVVLGVFLRSVAVPPENFLTVIHPTVNPRILVYGDSIAAGFSATTPPLQAWAQLVREAYATSLMLEAWGYRTLWEDCVNGTLRAAFVAQLAAQNPAKIWIAVGTNDYGLNKWTAANFGIAYAALLDDLHTALPSALIYCQSPIIRNGEAANGLGSTLGDYRTAVSNAASARSGYCTFVNGLSIVTLGDLADGTHPSVAGHVVYANYVKGILGL